jgi:hypothetical protein
MRRPAGHVSSSAVVRRPRRHDRLRDTVGARQVGVLVVAIAVFVATTLIRYLALKGFSNDHYQHLAGAQQMLMGELPTS